MVSGQGLALCHTETIIRAARGTVAVKSFAQGSKRCVQHPWSNGYIGSNAASGHIPLEAKFNRQTLIPYLPKYLMLSTTGPVVLCTLSAF